MEAWLLSLVAANPQVATALMVMGALRLAFKPLCGAIQQYVDSTETKDDDLWWADVQKSRYFKFAAWALDLVASVKLPKGKP